MSSDPGNMPFQRPAPYSELSAVASTAREDAAGAPDTLHAESILLQEFNHANVTAYQAKEERARTFNTYLVQAGIVISALSALETIYVSHPLHGLTIAGIVAGMVSAVGSLMYFARLFALGSTAEDSELAMNVIKEFYIQQLHRQLPQIEWAFHWRLATSRADARSDSMPLLMSLSTSLVGSLFFAFGVYLILTLQEVLTLPQGSYVQTTPTDLVIIVLAFGVGLIAFVVLYVALALRHRRATALSPAAETIGRAVPRVKR